MSSPIKPDRRTRLRAVLNLIVDRPEFRREEIQFLCSEAKPAVVTTILKQLSHQGILQTLVRADGEFYRWAKPVEKFSTEDWIESQIAGTQVSQIPAEERPRERLLTAGAQQLKNSDLLAILIRSGIKGESAIQAGQKLSNHFSPQIQRLVDATPVELKKISRAVSSTAYCQIMAGIELGRRVAEIAAQYHPKIKINSTTAAVDYCRSHFARLAQDAQQEEFHIVTLDTKLQPIQSHQITIGTLDASLVHPREVFRAAIRDAASAILLVHNHPSGDPTPSRQDREVTERLKKSGEIVGINVVDHVIVAKDQTISLADWR
jgi:DNA repair protein RadC